MMTDLLSALRAERDQLRARLTAIDRVLDLYSTTTPEPAPLVDGGRPWIGASYAYPDTGTGTEPCADGPAPYRPADDASRPWIGAPYTAGPAYPDTGTVTFKHDPNVVNDDEAAPAAVARNSRFDPWPDEDVATATRMLREGRTRSDIAAAMPHRTKRSVFQKCTKLRRQLETDSEEPGEPVEQGGVEPDLDTPSATLRVNFPKAAPLGASLPKPFPLPGLHGPWSRALDLDLIRSITVYGTTSTAWAEANGIDIDAVRRRVWAYCGNPPTYESQMRAIRALTALVGPAAEAAE